MDGEILFREIVDRNLNYIARCTADVYSRCRQEKESDYGLCDERIGSNFWKELVLRLILKDQIDPISFVRSSVRLHQYPPWPTSLCSDDLKDYYRAVFLPAQPTPCDSRRLKYHLESFESAVHRNPGPRTAHDILEAGGTRENRYSKLFLWCMAVRLKHNEIERRLRHIAVQDLLEPVGRRAYLAEMGEELAFLARFSVDDDETLDNWYGEEDEVLTAALSHHAASVQKIL